MKLFLAAAALAFIGILRTALEVKLGIVLDGKWFSYDRDVLLVMAGFPIYLCFYSFMCLHIILRFFRVRDTGRKLFAVLFFIQFVHLLIPLLDYLSFRYDIPCNITPYLNAQGMSYGFSLNPFSDITHPYLLPVYFTPLILLFTGVTTLGINCAWVISGAVLFFLLRREFRLSLKHSALVILLIFQLLYWPLYKYYFVFDGLFNAIAGIPYYNHFGYGAYFLIFGAAGLAYYLIASREEGF